MFYKSCLFYACFAFSGSLTILETDLGNGKNGQTNFNAINKKIRDEKCRWVDYIEKDGHKADGSKAEGAESDGPFRLAFK